MFKIIDHKNETVKDGFKTSGDGWVWLRWRFSEAFIKNMEFKVVREEEEDEQSEI